METVAEKSVCAACGADVRDGTQFCYACGESLDADPKTVETPEVDAEADPVEAAFETSAPMVADGSRAKVAAKERRDARIAKRKPAELEWQSPPDSANIILVVVALLIFIVTAAVVVLMVFMK